MTQFMIDLETLGKRPGCKILSIGAVEFSANGLGDRFYTSVTTEDQLGLDEDPETLAWWNRQSPEARRVLTEPKTAFVDGLEQFAGWVKRLGGPRSVYPWGNGADFDNAILHVAFDVSGVKCPWEFWNSRCYRTLKNLPGAPKFQKDKRAGVHHNALDDAVTQAQHAVEVFNALGLWKA